MFCSSLLPHGHTVVTQDPPEIRVIDPPVQPNVPQIAQIAGLFGPPETGGGGSVQIVHLYGLHQPWICRHKPGAGGTSGQDIQDGLLYHFDLVPVLGIQHVYGVAADPLHVDLRRAQDLLHFHAVAHRHNDGGRLHHNAFAKLVRLQSHHFNHFHQHRNTGGAARGDQVLVGLVEQWGAVENCGVLIDPLIYLAVDLLLGLTGVLFRHIGQETNVVIDERLAGHTELGGVGVQLAGG